MKKHWLPTSFLITFVREVRWWSSHRSHRSRQIFHYAVLLPNRSLSKPSLATAFAKSNPYTVASDRNFSHTEKRTTKRNVANIKTPLAVAQDWQGSVNWTVDVGLSTVFILRSTSILTLCCPIVSSSLSTCYWKGNSELLASHWHKCCVVSTTFKVHPVLIHQSLLFIFISTIIVIKRVLDDKNANIIHFVSCIVRLVTFNQYMEMSVVLILIHLSYRPVVRYLWFFFIGQRFFFSILISPLYLTLSCLGWVSVFGYLDPKSRYRMQAMKWIITLDNSNYKGNAHSLNVKRKEIHYQRFRKVHYNKFPRQVSPWGRRVESQGTVANTLAASQKKTS